MTDQESLSKYQKLTDREHILKKPDTYIGSIENTEHDGYIFDDGKIIEDGTHKQLLHANGHYATMWKMQAGGFLPDQPGEAEK